MHDIKAGHNQLLMAPLIERYIATVLIVVCTLAIRLVLEPVLANRAPYMFFLLAVVIITRLWGRGPGLTATLLGGIAAWYFLLEPRDSFAIASPSMFSIWRPTSPWGQASAYSVRSHGAYPD